MKKLIVLSSLLFSEMSFSEVDCNTVYLELEILRQKVISFSLLNGGAYKTKKNPFVPFSEVAIIKAYIQANYVYTCNCALDKEQVLKKTICREYLDRN